MNDASQPKAPDPLKTAQAQTGMNIDTAVAQQLVNQTNQNTPEGSLSYTQDGFNTYTDANGRTVQIPKFTANQTLSPGQQQLYDTNLSQQQHQGQLGLDQTVMLQDLLSKPIDLSNDAVESHLMDLGRARLDPQFAQSEDQLRTRLSNQGIQPGSDAWEAEMRNFSQGKNDAYNQLLLNGRGESLSELTQARQEPINEITALMSGSQVSKPNYVSTPQSSVAGTDYAGMVQNNFQNQQANYQSKVAQNNALMGGLFGLAGAGVKAFAPVP